MNTSTITDYKIWECAQCGYIYDESKGDPEEEIGRAHV